MKTSKIILIPITLITATSMVVACIRPITHQWNAQPVLVQLFLGGGYPSNVYPWETFPDLVIYADGHTIVTSYDHSGDELIRSINETQLSTVQICTILNQIDSFGFFEPDSMNYYEPATNDMGTFFIEVNAWKSNSIAIASYELSPVIDQLGLNEQEKVPAALTNTYKFLSQITFDNSSPYKPSHVALLIIPSEVSEATSSWPLESPSLKSLTVNLKDGHADVLLDGQVAIDLFTFFNGEITKAFMENGISYYVTLRPLLPFEIWSPDHNWSGLPGYQKSPTMPMACKNNSNQ